MSEVIPITKEFQLRDTRREPHGRGCPCKPCVGRRARRKGLERQRAAKKALHIPDNRFRSKDSSEENWLGALRVEVKSQGFVKPIVTKFLAAEVQSEHNRAIGDNRPFTLACMPDGWSKHDGLLVFRIKDAPLVVDALSELFDQWE